MNLWSLFFAVAAVESALIGTYYDNGCQIPISNVLAYTDVCTWATNQFTGALAVNLDSCSESVLEVSIYNASTTAFCKGTPDYTSNITSECSAFQDIYVKALNTSCLSGNSTYNLVAHFADDCNDGGVPFSIQLGVPCAGESFLPGFYDWDTTGFFIDPYYSLMVFNSTNGTCQTTDTVYQTTGFPAQCVAPLSPFHNISLDIYQAFPMV